MSADDSALRECDESGGTRYSERHSAHYAVGAMAAASQAPYDSPMLSNLLYQVSAGLTAAQRVRYPAGSHSFLRAEHRVILHVQLRTDERRATGTDERANDKGGRLLRNEGGSWTVLVDRAGQAERSGQSADGSADLAAHHFPVLWVDVRQVRLGDEVLSAGDAGQADAGDRKSVV